MKKLLTLLLVLPILAGAQEIKFPVVFNGKTDTATLYLPKNYVVSDSIVWNFIPKDTTVLNVIPKDTVVLNVIPKDTTILRISYKDTTIIRINYQDTCFTAPVDTTDNGGGPVVDPPPVTGEVFVFSVQQRTDWNNVSIPFSKGEVWSGQWIAPQPYKAADKYFRFSMHMFYNADGSFRWTKFDQEFQSAINAGQKFAFGIMTHYPDPANDHILRYDNAYSAYPKFLHDRMQAEAVKDWVSGTSWVPNWNSEAYISELLRLHKAISSHIHEKGWSGWVNYIDVRGYGAFGEWHGYTIADPITNSPAGTRATEATLKRIIDVHTEGFPDWPLVLLVSTFDANRLNNTKNPPGVAAYALRARNKWGLLGWRRDNWGATDAYLRDYTDRNTVVVDGMRLDTAIMNRWRYAPIVGEPCCTPNYNDFLTQVQRYRAVSVGNGNFTAGTVNANITAGLQAAGHRLTITGGQYKDGTVTVNWRNDGITPIYEDFDVVFELRTANGQVAKSYTFENLVSMRLPGGWSTTSNLTGLPAGTYDLHVIVKNDQRSYPLGITGSKLATIKL
jgi:hypothetical protein